MSDPLTATRCRAGAPQTDAATKVVERPESVAVAR
jgi:hypothetical protein